MGDFYLLSPVTGSKVNDSRPVGLGHWPLKGPSDCAQDSDWKIPLILCLNTFFFLGGGGGLEGNPLLLTVSHLFGV